MRPTPDGGQPWLPTVFAITATGILVNTLISASLPEVVAGVGAPRSAIGLVLAAATLPGIVLAPVIGLLADRFGRRRVVLPCLVLFGVSGVAGGFAPSLGVLLALRVLQGAGSAGLINLAIVIIGDGWTGAERSRRIGWNAAVLTTMLALVPTLGGVLTDTFGWRAPFAVYGLAGVTALLVWRTLPRVDPPPVDIPTQLRGALPLLRRREVAVCMLGALVLFTLITGVLHTVMPVHLADRFGLSASQRGLVVGIGSLTNTVGALSQGWLRPRLVPRVQLVAASLLLGAAVLVLVVAPTLLVLVPAVVAFGAGEGLSVPLLQDLAASAGDADRGLATAWFVSGQRTGQTLGPTAGGAGYAAGGAGLPLLAGAGLALVFAAVAWRGLRPAPAPVAAAG